MHWKQTRVGRSWIHVFFTDFLTGRSSYQVTTLKYQSSDSLHTHVDHTSLPDSLWPPGSGRDSVRLPICKIWAPPYSTSPFARTPGVEGNAQGSPRIRRNRLNDIPLTVEVQLRLKFDRVTTAHPVAIGQPAKASTLRPTVQHLSSENGFLTL